MPKYTREVVDADVLETWINVLREKVDELDDEFLQADIDEILDEMSDFIGVPRE
jgi:hypothetical protein